MINPFVKKTKALLNRLGELSGRKHNLHPDDASVGPQTLRALEVELAALEVYPNQAPATPEIPVSTAPGHAENPAYKEAKKYEGKGENDSKFVAWLSAFWPKAGLPHFKTIIGASFAWCGLFVLAMNTQVGQKAISGAAGARNWATYGVAIDWQKDGVPEGSVVHLNHAGNCKSGKDNHVMFSDADCTPADLKKPNAVIPGLGGNQSNRVKRSIFSAKEICEVRWPSEIPKPGPITVSKDCNGKAVKESTQ